MGLLSSPFSRLLGLVAILALYISFTGSYLGSAALSGTAARALYLLALCLFIGARACFWLPALAMHCLSIAIISLSITTCRRWQLDYVHLWYSGL